jgi:hypothetical protein
MGSDAKRKYSFKLIKESATKASEILNDVLIWALDQENQSKTKNYASRP